MRWHIILAAIFALVLAIAWVPAHASEGDDDPVHRACYDACMLGDRPLVDPAPAFMAQFWNLEGNCRYECSREHDLRRQAAGIERVQYYGKWPFARVLGFQEIASAAFSFLNLVVHIHGLQRILTELRVDSPFRGAWLVYAFAQINAWIWSTLFHSRDVAWTESFDYLSAVFVIYTSLTSTLMRVLNLRAGQKRTIFLVCMYLFCACHFYYMIFIKWDYVWNVAVCSTCGVLMFVGWTYWAIKYRRPYAWRILVSLGTILSCGLLEIFDFPPIMDVFDAHSIWHLATVLPSMLWYSHHIIDGQYEEAQMQLQAKSD